MIEPMNDERKHKWLPVLFFMLTGVVIGASVYLIAASAMESEARAYGGQKGVTAVAAPAVNVSRAHVVLRRGVRNSFGKVDVVYRGIKDDQIKLDVFIRDLDPDYPYRREIDQREAKDGFRLGGVRFDLISAGRTKAKMRWHRQD
ncbi:MAG: hypothetical protein QNJ48_05930 [Desulfobacterales bacterium]|nr:hypothetical protein [Desulfobacterales bacterium]